MPVVFRLFGLDLSLFGTPMAEHVHMLSNRPDGMLVAHYPCRGKASTATPRGYRINTLYSTIGHGSQAWYRAKKALETGDGLELPWVRIWRWGNGSRWHVHDTFVLAARILPFVWSVNVNKVVHVRRGRRYVRISWGTTARHFLKGEEQVGIEKKPDGQVVFSLRSFSRPNAFMAWVTYPIIVWKQRAFARDVCKRLVHIVNDAPE